MTGAVSVSGDKSDCRHLSGICLHASKGTKIVANPLCRKRAISTQFQTLVARLGNHTSKSSWDDVTHEVNRLRHFYCYINKGTQSKCVNQRTTANPYSFCKIREKEIQFSGSASPQVKERRSEEHQSQASESQRESLFGLKVVMRDRE